MRLDEQEYYPGQMLSLRQIKYELYKDFLISALIITTLL